MHDCVAWRPYSFRFVAQPNAIFYFEYAGMGDQHVCDCLLAGWEQLLSILASSSGSRSKPLDRFKKDDDLNKALNAYSFVSLTTPPLLSSVSNRRAQGSPASFTVPVEWCAAKPVAPVALQASCPSGTKSMLNASALVPGNFAEATVRHVPLYAVREHPHRSGRQSFQNIAELAYGVASEQPYDMVGYPHANTQQPLR